jgi:hypothetical protein
MAKVDIRVPELAQHIEPAQGTANMLMDAKQFELQLL